MTEEELIQFLKNNLTVKVDLMKVNDIPFILRCGLGYDANIIAKTSLYILINISTY